MDKAVLGVGILIILAAIWIVVKPQVCVKMMGFLARGRMVYLVGLLRLAIGGLLLVSARECGRVWIVIALGVLFLISGALIFIVRLDRIKATLTWLSKRSAMAIRLMALVPVAIGAVIIWACCAAPA